ncbi:acyl-CoA dehydrogenase family protein [Intrasporangium sp.]|uniref:acyl-CoA dehydrogenase family protein n=1 Tax=Intrasporangium sp. TaxID=1925024 RepID=UPI00293A48E0|nr:acyl-CoA dehydrogenase family protein [Intrasporangium sp.]MDV3221166.1 acyl-CoA dehydrogenase family protein [Intrasporangium sp.]
MAGLEAHDLVSLRESVGAALSAAWPDAPVAGAADADDRIVAAWDALHELDLDLLADEGALDALVVVADELGRRGCPVPLADGYVVRRLLGGERAEWAGGLRAVLHVGTETGSSVRHVEAAAGASHVAWLDPEAGTLRLRPVESVAATPGLPSPAWSAVTVGSAAPVDAPGTAAEEGEVWECDVSRAAVDEALHVLRLATAARALGASSAAAEAGADHVKVRKQFGTTVGAFQAVAHRVVDCAIDVAAGDALVQDAVRRRLDEDPAWLLAAQLAVAHVLEVAPRVQFAAHLTLGAVGYFEEHRAPWLFRRVHADLARLRVLADHSAGIAERIIEGGEGLPGLRFGPEAEKARREVRELVRAAFSDGLAPSDPELASRLADHGWIAPALPVEFGGLGATAELQLAIDEELAYWGAAIHPRTCAGMLGPSIDRHGTEAQRRTFLPLIARGQLPFYLAYSEPEAGSDLAHLRTTAVRDGDDWVVNGQKMWGTGAYRADWGWLAARTDPAAEAHAGISIFLFRTSTPGWSRQDHTALSGERSCTTFFDDVRIPDENRIGPLHGGWSLLTEALAHERVVIAGGTGRLLRLFDELVALLRADPEASLGPIGSSSRATLARLATHLQAARVLGARASASAVSSPVSPGHGSPADAPMAKIIASEFEEEFGVESLSLLGPDALVEGGVPVSDGWSFENALRYSIMAVVSGGTNDIQRNIIARALGLPRR